MAWHSTLLTQNGNSVVPYRFLGNFAAGAPRITSKDNIVVGPEAGNSYVEIERIQVRANIDYIITVRVTGAAAVGFRFWAEEMD